MHRRLVGLAILAMLLTLGQPPAAQAPGTANIPRTPDRKPNLSGIWQVMNTAAWNIEAHSAQKGVPAGQGVVEGGDIPYQAWALAKKKENYANRATADPESHCYLPGVPRASYLPFPFQIVQLPDAITILYEFAHTTRFMYTNGKPHPPGEIEWWMGDSRGRWEGDTLSVEVVHFNDQTWFDSAGNFHSNALHEVERWTLLDADHIGYEVTIEDPNVFTRPWKMSMVLYRHTEKNFQLLDYDCTAVDLEQYYPYPGVDRR